jgi:hypothetical protein
MAASAPQNPASFAIARIAFPLSEMAPRLRWAFYVDFPRVCDTLGASR